MLALLSEMGRSFLRAFLGSLVVLLPGLLSAPNLGSVSSWAVAALVGALAAGLKAIQVFLPQLTFSNVLPTRVRAYGKIVDSFVRAFLSAFVVSVLGWLSMPDLSVSRSLLVGIVVAAVTAGFRAVQGLFTPGDVPQPTTGLTTPPSK